MRAFLALPLPADLQRALEELGRGVAHLRAQKAPTIHLTLRFLGEIEDPEAVAGAVAPVAAAHTPFELRLGRLGAFPSPRSARVLWAGLKQGEMPAGALAAGIEDALLELGFPRERRPWRGHITLGRFRSPRRLAPEVADRPLDQLPPFRAERVILFRSILTPQGALHEALRELSLGGGKTPVDKPA